MKRSNSPLASAAALAIATALTLTGAPAPAGAAEIKVGGGSAPVENIFKRIAGPLEKGAGVKIHLSAEGPDQALLQLMEGKLDVATAGLSMQDWVHLMESKGIPIKDPKELKARVIGRDRVQVLANKSATGVKSLSKEQLKGIFTGKITNWKDVGGPDQAIVLVLGTKTPGLNQVWQEKILDKEAYAPAAKAVGDTTEIKKTIQETPGAIGVGPVSADMGDLHSPDAPEVGRPITAVTRGIPSLDVQKMFDFLRGDGQKHIVR